MILRSERLYKVERSRAVISHASGFDATPWWRFTLVELIVVLTIFMALASIVLPVVYRASLQAKSVLCSSNLAQLGSWLTAYAAANDNRLFPYQMGWVPIVATQGQLVMDQEQPPANEFMCPSQPYESIGGIPAAQLWRGSHYGINEHIASDLRNQSGDLTAHFAIMRLTDIRDPAGKVTMGDASGGNFLGIPDRDPVITGISRRGFTHADALPPNPAQPLPYHRHLNGTTNLVFMDNHAENLTEWPRFMIGPGTYGYQMWHPEHTYPGSGFAQ